MKRRECDWMNFWTFLQTDRIAGNNIRALLRAADYRPE
jgi:hypothetical protein